MPEPSTSSMPVLDTEAAVRRRYSSAAETREAALCCPVDYDTRYLEVIPQEVIDRDYGCGDPSQYVRQGETVLDLGSGGGKICFIAAQVVGTSGRVIGVDKNDEMLALARRSQPEVAANIGYDNVQFFKGKIQDLRTDLERVDRYLAEQPIRSEADLRRYESFVGRQRAEEPMIADHSIDVVVSNCVLNLVDPVAKQQLFNDIYRVLRPGGRAVISDIVSDEPVPLAMQQDEQLWSGCISGALQEHEFLEAFAHAGFEGIQMPVYGEQPWQTVEGIEFRSATVIAHKFADGSRRDLHQAVIYRGPYARVIDDQGQVFARGLRTAVDGDSFEKLQREPYQNDFVAIRPGTPVDPARAAAFSGISAAGGEVIERPASVTKGGRVASPPEGDACCGDGGCC